MLCGSFVLNHGVDDVWWVNLKAGLWSGTVKILKIFKPTKRIIFKSMSMKIAVKSSKSEKLKRKLPSIYCWRGMISYDHQCNIQCWRLFAGLVEKSRASFPARLSPHYDSLLKKEPDTERILVRWKFIFHLFPDAFRVENSMEESMWNHVAAVKNISL